MNFSSDSGSGVSSRSLLSKDNIGSLQESQSSRQKPTYSYLQALLGDNPPTPGLFDHATVSKSNFMTPLLNVKEESSVTDDEDKISPQFTEFKVPNVPPLR